jgi:Bacterial membrane protein YfhO
MTKGTNAASSEAGREDRVWSRSETLRSIVIVLLFAAAAAALWPLTNAVVPWDSKNHFYPMLRYLGTALEHGELPFWNPYHFSGHPSVADPQSLLFMPTMLLFAWLVPSPSMQLFDAVVFAHFLPGAIGILLLFRKRRWRPAGAIVAAMIFMLGGSASARLQHTGMIFSYGAFPLALWLLDEALERRSYLYGVLFAAAAAVMTVGRDQVAFLCALTLIGFAVWRIWEADDRLGFARSRVGVLATAGAVGAGLLAVPVILTMQFLMTSTRPSFGFGVAAMGSLPPQSLATLFFSDVFGSLRTTYDYWGPDWQSMAAGTWTDRATNYLFAGTVPALLLLWHGIAGGRLFAREFRFFLIVGLAAILYALGRYTPLFEIIFDRLPGVALYRRPADATFLINFALAFASGYLLHRWLEEGSPKLAGLRRVASVGLSGLLLVAALAGALAFAWRGNHLSDALRDVALAVVIATVIATLVAKSGPLASRRAAIAALLVAFTGGELLWRNAASALNAEPAERYAVFRELPPEQLQGLQVLKKELAERNARGERPRVEILGLGGAWQNASMVLGLEDTIGYNPLRLADYEKAVGPGENAVDPNLRHFPGTFRGYKCRLASLLGLEYLVLDRPIERLPRHFPRLAGTRLLYGSGAMWVYRLNTGAPRAYLATHLVPVDSETVLQQAELPDFDRPNEALVDEVSLDVLKGDYGLRDDATAADPAVGSVRITGYRRNEVVLTVETDRNSVVVLHDIFYPGWEAYVDGKRQPILRANLLFRGVEVGPGQHTLAFRFRPLSMDNLVAAASGLVGGQREESDDGETVTQ